MSKASHVCFEKAVTYVHCSGKFKQHMNQVFFPYITATWKHEKADTKMYDGSSANTDLQVIKLKKESRK